MIPPLPAPEIKTPRFKGIKAGGKTPYGVRHPLREEERETNESSVNKIATPKQKFREKLPQGAENCYGL
jgi:hypothetical protein